VHPLLLSLLLVAAPPPRAPGVYRRAAATADGVHLALFLYLPERAEPGAPLVVLLPDLGATHAFFDVAGHGLARELSARGFEVATLDWRGSGLSETPAHPASIEELLTQDLPALLAGVAAPDRPLALVGWGYGGAIAYAAAAGPLQARVRSVVVFNGVVDLDVPNALVERMLAETAGPLDLARRLSQPAPNRKGSLFRVLWLHGGTLDAELGLELQSSGLATLSSRQVADLRAWMQSGTTHLGGDYPALLSGLRAPVLALDGILDNWTHPEFAATVRNRLPAAQLRLYPISRFEGFGEDLGHVGMILGPCAEREIVPLVANFLREHQGVGP